MARLRGANCRLCRREGEKLFLKGDRCFSTKCGVVRKPYAPGLRLNTRRKNSDYGLQLREKQKAKKFYGLLEKPFRKVFENSRKKAGVVGENFIINLELRFDNIVYRLGLAASRKEARQLIVHEHFLVNGVKANIPSMLLNEGDEIKVKDSSKKSPKFAEMKDISVTTPVWLNVNMKDLSGKVEKVPSIDEIEAPINAQLIVELYSK